MDAITTGMDTLFANHLAPPPPLAEQLRPQRLDQVVGQPHLLGQGGTLTRLLAQGHLPSLIFWGPPGCGKTTLARLLASQAKLQFEQVSAVFTGVAELKKIFEAARARRQDGIRTLLFVDEIHRFNRSQQDSFLPYMEDGTITLLGATTENPSFELNAALLSRAQVLVLRRLDEAALEQLLQSAEQTVGHPMPITADARSWLCQAADGDGRYLLNMAEQLLAMPATQPPLDSAALASHLQQRAAQYDKGQDGHYNLISALHKSLRGSDVDAALYWLARMLTAGEQPIFLLRRLTRFASEDVGMADPTALTQAISAWQAYERLGSPEGELAIVQLVVYLATAPKSNALYVAQKAAMAAANSSGSLPPPKHILNAPTKLMKAEGYGAGYIYDHDTAAGFSGQNYFPDQLPRQSFYQPRGQGREAQILERLKHWEKLRSKG